jgi:hypothetical protein
VLDENFYIPSIRPSDHAPVVVTASGNQMPMRRLASWCDLSEQHFAHRKAEVAQSIRRDLLQRVSRLLEQDVRRICELFTAVTRVEAGLRAGDFGLEGAETRQLPLEDAVEELLSIAPRPEIPWPAFSLCGRLWRLQNFEPRGTQLGKLHLRFGDRIFELQGDYTLTDQVLVNWNDKLRSLLLEKADELAARVDQDDDEKADVDEAQQAIRNCGAYERGDLLFVAGPPPIVARILPPLGNVAFGRVAIGVPVRTPLRASPQAVFRRNGVTESWKQLSPGRHVCTGPSKQELKPDPSPVEVLFYLRACAIRFAQNDGRFSEFD